MGPCPSATCWRKQRRDWRERSANGKRSQGKRTMPNRDPSLSPAQLEQFRREGYLVLPAAFDAAEVRHMQAEADRILELILNSSVALRRRSGRLDWRELPDGSQIVRKIQPINDLSEYLTEGSTDAPL